jgi:hypothetical protein
MIYSIYRKINYFLRKKVVGDSIIVKKYIINDPVEVEKLWEIYNKSFEKLNKMSPCKQSFNREFFFEILKEDSVIKYIALEKFNNEIIGLGLLSNDFKNSPWISEEYFKEHYPEQYSRGEAYYFLGIAVSSDHRKKGHSLSMLNYISSDIPKGAIMGFDHSNNINPFLHHFTKIIKNSKSVERKNLDRQHYHIIHFN